MLNTEMLKLVMKMENETSAVVYGKSTLMRIEQHHLLLRLHHYR